MLRAAERRRGGTALLRLKVGRREGFRADRAGGDGFLLQQVRHLRLLLPLVPVRGPNLLVQRLLGGPPGWPPQPHVRIGGERSPSSLCLAFAARPVTPRPRADLTPSAFRLFLAFRDTELQGLQTSLTAGSYLGIPSGLVYDRIKHWHRLGPRLVILTGCFFNFLGYFCFWSAATGRFDSVSYGLVCFFALVAGFGSTWFDTSVMATNIHNLQEDKGFVIGALKSFVGLGAGVSTQIFKAYFSSHPLTFLIMLAMGPSAIAAVVCVFTNIVPHKQASSQSKTKRAYTVAVVTGLLIVALLFSSTFVSFLKQESGKVALVWVILGIFLPMLASPVYTGGWRSIRSDAIEDETMEGLLQSLADPTQAKDAAEASIDGNGGLTFLETMKRLDFWLLFTCFGVISGSGLTLLHNLGQLVPALTDGRQTSCTVFVQLFSLMNCIGRLSAGYFSQHMLDRKKTPRTLFVVLDCLLTSLNFVLLLFASIETLYIPVLIGGLAFGMNWALVPAILCELFGTKAFASNYNMVAMSSTLSDFVLSTVLSGRLYDREKRRQHHNGSAECYGMVCFRTTFVIVAGVALLSCLASLTLLARSRGKYKQM